jgi:hypothetical protein
MLNVKTLKIQITEIFFQIPIKIPGIIAVTDVDSTPAIPSIKTIFKNDEEFAYLHNVVYTRPMIRAVNRNENDIKRLGKYMLNNPSNITLLPSVTRAVSTIAA